MTSIGYVGLGTMGRGMVVNLLEAEHDVTVWNRTPPNPGVGVGGRPGVVDDVRSEGPEI